MEITDPTAGSAPSDTAAGGSLMAVMYVYSASEVELTGQETLRLDQLAYSDADGFTLRHYGELLPPGTTTLQLDQGVYALRAVKAIQMRMGVDSAITTVTSNDTKGGWPDPPSAPVVWSSQSATLWKSHIQAFTGAGFGSARPAPVLTVIRGDERG